MWKKIKIGESQIPQILCMIAGVAFLMGFTFTDKPVYVFLTMVMLQASCLLMCAYDEHLHEKQDEKRSNEEAFAMLESMVKSNG